MAFVAPRLTIRQAHLVISEVWVASRGRKKRFLKLMRFLCANNYFRPPEGLPRINFTNRFDPDLDNSTARVRYGFTIPQLQLIVTELQLPRPEIRTGENDTLQTIEALTMVCRRLREPSSLFTVANEFGCSVGHYSRVCRHVMDHLYEKTKDLLYFNRAIVLKRLGNYCDAITRKGSPLSTCWAFIDGTKQYVSRPSARENPSSDYENLQCAIYNGHPRRHCFNWQAITTPDGIIISLFGPIEGRRHDSTMLSLSGVLDEFFKDECFKGKVIYDDPAYGCSEYVCCPFPSSKTAAKAIFNARMSSVREAVEWGFCRVKVDWSFVNWDKKMRTRQTPVGKMFFVAALLTNLRTCLKHSGNQISTYFDLKPPSLDEHLNNE